MAIENKGKYNKLQIDEANERLNKFLEILLKADLRTIERLRNKELNNFEAR